MCWCPFIGYDMCSPICHFLLWFQQSDTGKRTVPSWHQFHEEMFPTWYLPLKSTLFMQILVPWLFVYFLKCDIYSHRCIYLYIYICVYPYIHIPNPAPHAHLLPRMECADKDIWIYSYVSIYIYMYRYKYSLELGKESNLLILIFCNLALQGPSSTQFWKPVLWECSYGPWDHVTFSAKMFYLLWHLRVRIHFLEKTSLSRSLSICWDPSSSMWEGL